MIGRILKEKREDLGLTQNEIAEMLMLSPQSISKWERELAEPSIEYLPKLAKIFECPIEDFFELDKYSVDNLDLTSSLFIKLSREGKFEDAKKQLLSNDIEINFIESLFDKIENKIKLGEERFVCLDIQEGFNFGYLRAIYVIDWLIDLGVLEKENNSIDYSTVINQEKFYKIQSRLINGDNSYYYQNISISIINEFFIAFNQNTSLIDFVLKKSKALKDLLKIVCKELCNENKINTSVLQAWFEIDFEKAHTIFTGLKDSEIIVKKYGIMVGNNEKLKKLKSFL